MLGLLLAMALVAGSLLLFLPAPIDPVARLPDPDGDVVHNLQDTAAGFNNITSVNECGGSLYLGSLTMPGVARYRP